MMRAKSAAFHLIILATIISFVALGVWQLQRREWKHEIMAEMGDRLAALPVTLRSHMGDEFYWRYANVTGMVDYSRAITIPRYAHDTNCAHENAHGLLVIAPLQLKDGGEVLLRLGWYPGDSFTKIGQEKISTTGVIRPFSTTWLPAYDTVSHNWLRPAADMYDKLKLPRQSYYVDNAVSEPSCHFPQSVWAQPELFDNHLQYAVTWFTLAAVLLALYIYRTWTVRKHPNPPSPGR